MNSVDYSTMMTNDTLAHLVIINQMAATTGCTHDQAKQLLTSTEWRLEVLVSLLLDSFTTMSVPSSQPSIFSSTNEQYPFHVANSPR